MDVMRSRIVRLPNRITEKCIPVKKMKKCNKKIFLVRLGAVGASGHRGVSV